MKNGGKDINFGYNFEILKPDPSKHLTFFLVYTKNIAPIDFSYSSEHSALSHIRHHVDHRGNEELRGNHMQSLPGVLEQWDRGQGSI